jgi:hypothetical protein
MDRDDENEDGWRVTLPASIPVAVPAVPPPEATELTVLAQQVDITNTDGRNMLLNGAATALLNGAIPADSARVLAQLIQEGRKEEQYARAVAGGSNNGAADRLAGAARRVIGGPRRPERNDA